LAPARNGKPFRYNSPQLERTLELRERFGNFRIKLDGVRMVAFYAMELVASLEHAVEFVDEHGDGLVTFVRLDGRIHIGAGDLDVALGGELHADRGITVALQFHAKPHDALLVAK